jgi:hypothetical protein
MQTEKPKRQVGRVRASLAVLIALLFLGILIPNTGRVIVDTSTTPATFQIVGRPQQIAMLVGLLLVPFGCIFLGARRSRVVETIGWVLLVGLFILATQKGKL